MRISIQRQPVQTIVRWTRRILLASAAGLLSYSLYFQADGWYFQRREQAHLEQLLLQPDGPARPPGDGQRSPGAAEGVVRSAVTGSLIGRVDIPRLELSVIVLEGVDSTILRRAAGHIPGTAFPGKPGNVGISAHRDTFFRPLRNIRKYDRINLTTPGGEYRYRVVSTAVVKPERVEVLEADGGHAEVLTLVTCYPFFYVGSAPDRYVVRAERVREEAKVSGP